LQSASITHSPIVVPPEPPPPATPPVPPAPPCPLELVELDDEALAAVVLADTDVLVESVLEELPPSPEELAPTEAPPPTPGV
jgi:hypothetical protein